jgi:hypothetical protein
MTPTSYLPFVDFPHYLAVTRDVAFHAETVSYAHVDMVQVNHRYNLNDEGDAYDRLQEIVYRHLLRVLADAGYQLQKDLCSFTDSLQQLKEHDVIFLGSRCYHDAVWGALSPAACRGILLVAHPHRSSETEPCFLYPAHRFRLVVHDIWKTWKAEDPSVSELECACAGMNEAILHIKYTIEDLWQQLLVPEDAHLDSGHVDQQSQCEHGHGPGFSPTTRSHGQDLIA